MINDEFKKSLLAFPICWGGFILIDAATRRLFEGTDILMWCGLVAFALPILWLWIGMPIWQRRRRQQLVRHGLQALEQRRFLEVVSAGELSRKLWPGWEGLTLSTALAQLALWRIHDARLSLGRLLTVAVEPADERVVLGFAVAAAELAADAENARERVERARIPRSALVFADLIRAARERDFKRVVELHAACGTMPTFQPLLDALLAWAVEESSPRPIDKVALLGETGVEQVEAIWPDFADFIRRAPPV